MFILASKSPQRKAILERLGVAFTVIPSDIDEASSPEKDPVVRARLLAEMKAADVSRRFPDHWVIGVDTLVVASDGSLLEKPIDEEDARRMLRLHSGKVSIVHSALCLMKGEEHHTEVSSARVTFKKFSEDLMEWWIRCGLWRDRSGAFQIEGEGRKLVESVEGEYETVVGFPVQLFQMLCKDAHILYIVHY
jgi:septum formation protein